MIVAIISDKTFMLFMVQKPLPLPLPPNVRNLMISPLISSRHFDARESNYTAGAKRKTLISMPAVLR